ncbi:MAG: AI-2E family transporter [Armatimonadota bacterium]|nr:AI-2E family transporter [Armatimonadota bacterium]
MLIARPLPPRDYVRAGFYLALGVVLLALLAAVTRRFAEATLAVITPFALGLVLALLLDPLVHLLLRRGMTRMPATGLVFVVFLLLIVGLGWLIIPALIAEAGDLAQNGPDYIAGVQDYARRFLEAHHKIGPFTLPPTVDQLTQQISGRASALVQDAGGRVVGFLVGSVTVVIQLILTLIIAFFFLADMDRLRARLFYLAPEKWRKPMGQMGSDVGGVFSDYLRGLLIVCALYGAATIGLLYLLSLWHHSLASYALLVGVAAGVLYAVPYLGSTATALITFVVAFAAATGDHQSGLAFGGIAVLASLALNQVFDGGVTPRVVGGGVGLHPILAIFALVIGGELFGIWGMLLSVPIAGSIQVILFRLYPKLTQATPPPFLHAQGVAPDERESAKVLEGDQSVTTERQQAEKKTEDKAQ